MRYKGSQVIYECVRCGHKDTEEKWERDGITFKCPNCSYKVGKKVRPPVVKQLKAE